MKKHKNLVIAVIATVVIAGGGGFFGGMKYGQSQNSMRGPGGQFAGARGNINVPGGAAGARLRTGAGFVNGDILSKDDKSITVKNRDGGSKIIFFAPSTSIGKTTDGTAADLTVGENVMVNGTANADGTVTATNIQIRPAGSIPFGGPGGGPNGFMPINGSAIPSTSGNVPNNK
jgi:hypothetical protein